MRVRPAPLCGLFIWPAAAVAGRPDDSHLTDAQLQEALWQIAAGLVFMAALGCYGWWRYRRGYVPAPGRFTPGQALVSVLAVLFAILLCAAWRLHLLP